MTKHTIEKCFLGGMMVFCGIFVVTSMKMDIGSMSEPGPGFLPLILGGVGILITGFLLLAKSSPENKEAITDFTAAGLKRFASYIITIMLFAFLFTELGPAAVFLLIIILAKTSGFESLPHAMLFAGIFTAIVYFLFWYLLVIPLPLGFFEEMW